MSQRKHKSYEVYKLISIYCIVRLTLFSIMTIVVSGFTNTIKENTPDALPLFITGAVLCSLYLCIQIHEYYSYKKAVKEAKRMESYRDVWMPQY